MESFFNSLINIPSDFIWKYLFYILIGLGLFFTIRFGFIQFRYFIEMFRIVGEKPEGNKGVSSMQAFFISASRHREFDWCSLSNCDRRTGRCILDVGSSCSRYGFKLC